MKLQIVSDLHLEFGDLSLPGGEVLIIAGDMFEARSLGRNDSSRARKTAENIKRFLKDELGKYENVLYVPGNHEYYGRSLRETHNLLLNNLPAHVSMLQAGSSRRIGEAQFIGATLWTDANQGCPITEQTLKRNMNDFTMIEDFPVSFMVSLHKQHMDEIRNKVKETALDKTVVITHHAPSFKSVDEKYKDEYYMNGGYASNHELVMLDNPNIKLWVHGHMHSDNDYVVGETRVISNPRGYMGYELRARNYTPKEVEV